MISGLLTNDPRDIEIYIDDTRTGPQPNGAYTSSALPTASDFAPGAEIYLTDLKRPAWTDGSAWSYADGTLV
jgi:hypothetical protein